MGGGGSKTQTATTDNSPWAGQQPYLTRGYQEAENFLNSGGPQVWGGQRVAAPSQGTTDAMGGLLSFSRSSPFQTSVQGMERTAGGAYLNPMQNPAFTGMVNDAIGAARPSIDSAFASAGRFGSGARDSAMADAIARASTGLAYQEYGRERGNQIAAQQALPGMYLTGIGASQAAGGMQDAYNQAVTDSEIGRFDEEQSRQLRTLSAYQGLLGNIVPGMQTSTQRGGGGNSALQGVGAAAGLLGGLGGFGQGAAALYALSDARAKEDIRPVGALDNGLTVYAYRYKGDATPQIGLLAQEVAASKPGAVGLRPDGMLAVNYDAATI